MSFSMALRHCFLLFSFWVISLSAIADPVDRQSLTVAYIYNFAKNVEWPKQSLRGEFQIGVYGEVGTSLKSAFDLLEENNKVNGLPIRVHYINDFKSINSLQLLYVIDLGPGLINDFYQTLDGAPVLLVTQNSTDQSLVMINLLDQGSKIRFEVNKSNLINQGLLPLPELILNGGTEIDVAELYRQGQNSLVKLQKNLNQREKQLQILESKITEQEALNNNLQTDMQELHKDIEVSAMEIEKQKAIINQQNIDMANFSQEKNLLLAEIKKRTEELESQKNILSNVTAKISQGESRLKELDAVIQDQEMRLAKQDVAISDLDHTVSSQKRILFYSWVLVILGLLLAATISFAYVVKRRDNRRLAERAEDLQFAKDRLLIAKRKADEASQAKGEFLSLMSHELRTPLQSIIGYTEVVLEELSQSGENRHLSDLNRVITNSERLLKLINNVLDLAKSEAGQMKLDLTPIKLSGLAEDAVSNIKPIADKKGLLLQVDVQDGDYLPVADPEKILLIMINLMGNAVKFTSTGSVSLRAVHLRDAIEINVKDTGPGISEDQLEKIFEAFHQSERPRHKKIEGTGLGLALTKQFVELMSGRINVKSEMGKGAEFSIRIPLPIQPANETP
jgi:signal transduction histidine kinase